MRVLRVQARERIAEETAIQYLIRLGSSLGGGWVIYTCTQRVMKLGQKGFKGRTDVVKCYTVYRNYGPGDVHDVAQVG